MLINNVGVLNSGKICVTNKIGSDLEKEDIKEGLDFDNKDISNEELLELDQEKAYEEEEVEEKPAKITSDQLGMIITKADELCDLVKEFDPIAESKSEVQNGIQKLMKRYKVQQKSNKRKQTKIENFFVKKPKQ